MKYSPSLPVQLPGFDYPLGHVSRCYALPRRTRWTQGSNPPGSASLHPWFIYSSCCPPLFPGKWWL